MGWWCFLYSHEVGNVLVCATCLPPLLCGADEKGTFWTLSTYVTLQSKVNWTALNALFRKACSQGCPVAGIWELGFRKGSYHCLTDKDGCSKLLWFMFHACFSSEIMEFCYVLGRGCLGDQSPMKTLSSESLMNFPGRPHFTLVKACCRRRKACPVWLRWERTLGSSGLAPSGFCPMCLLPLLLLFCLLLL